MEAIESKIHQILFDKTYSTISFPNSTCNSKKNFNAQINFIH